MRKYLILSILALALSFSADAQQTSTHQPLTRLKLGFALDYEHIQAPMDQDLGRGSGWGGSLFFRLPFSKHLELDWSVDIAGGHVNYRFAPYSPFMPPPNAPPPPLVVAPRSFTYTGIPVYLVYSHSFGQVRVFAGAGFSIALISMDERSYHGWALGPDCDRLTASFKAGVELYRHIVLSGEFRPWTTNLEHSNYYNHYKVTNLASVKLGYEFQPTKHSRRSRSHT